MPNLTPAQPPALPAELIEAVKDYATASKAERTRHAYARAWVQFEDWCNAHGHQTLPSAPATVAGWMAWLASGGDGRPRSVSTIGQALAAIIYAHRIAGHGFDRKDRLISAVWSGICRTKARTQVVREAQPLMTDDLRALLQALMRPQILAEVRDAALLGLGWAGALRRSELVGLDWQERGTGTGWLVVGERGITITLMASKASQEAAETIVVPRSDALTVCEAVEHWASAADLAKGEPFLRGITKGGQLGTKRMDDGSVSRIIKARVRMLGLLRGKTDAEIEGLIAGFSGHSLRAGYATSAAATGIPSYRIKQHTRHKSDAMVSRYVREGDKWASSGLKGIGL